MQVVSKTSTPSGCGHGYPLPDRHTIGQLFRDYGEEYIRVYRPDQRTIKLIRSIRICRTPALGGTHLGFRFEVPRTCALSGDLRRSGDGTADEVEMAKAKETIGQVPEDMRSFSSHFPGWAEATDG